MGSKIVLKNAQDQEFSINHLDNAGAIAIDSNDISTKSQIETTIAPYNKGFKNYIINGNFDVWQRANSQTISGYGSDDRWRNGNAGSTKTHSLVACTDTERALFNASYFSRTVVSSVAGVNNQVLKEQYIEDVTRLAGKTVTLSFWAKANSNKNIGVNIAQVFGTGGSPSNIVYGTTQIVALTSTWQKKSITVTIPSIVGKTLGTNGAHTSFTALQFYFDQGSATRGSVLGQQSGTFDIAQVQLEEGSFATPFEQRPVVLELSLCQRYYERFVCDKANGELFSHERVQSNTSQNYVTKIIPFRVPMRVTPTVTIPRVFENVTDYATGWAVYFTGLSNGDGGIAIYKNIGSMQGNIIAFDAIADAEL